jgi:hypothetical protein
LHVCATKILPRVPRLRDAGGGAVDGCAGKFQKWN